MVNRDIRLAAAGAGVKLWQIAERLNGGMSDSNFSRKLRNELPQDEKQRIKAIIEELARKDVPT